MKQHDTHYARDIYALMAAWLLILLFACLLLAGCKTTRYTANIQEKATADSIMEAKADSVYTGAAHYEREVEHVTSSKVDSVSHERELIITQDAAGNVIGWQDYRREYIYKERETDTARINMLLDRLQVYKMQLAEISRQHSEQQLEKSKEVKVQAPTLWQRLAPFLVIFAAVGVVFGIILIINQYERYKATRGI